MSETRYVFAIDAMGGDKAPVAVIAGLNQFLFSNDSEAEVHFRIFGQEAQILPLLKKYPRVQRNSTFIHCADKISGTDKVREVIRTAGETSMYQAIKDVRVGNSIAIISAGNTGILMALSKLALKTIDGVSRPAITTILPAGSGTQKVVILDLGANVICDEINLIDFSIMGSVYSKVMAGTNRPKLGLLNIGEEDQKGLESLQKLNHLYKEHIDELPFEYIGFIEGTDISKGIVDVVVTDGFTGNIVLKTIEGTAKLLTRAIKETFKKSAMAVILYFFLSHVFKRLKQKMDPRSYAGAIFLGLNGYSIKTHGNSDALTFSNAIRYALELAQNDFNKQIQENIKSVDFIKQSLHESESEHKN